MVFPRRSVRRQTHEDDPRPKLAPVLAACAGMLLFGQPGARAAEGITAVSSKVSKDYVRVRFADGSFQAEEYAFGDGSHYGGPSPNNTIGKMSFLDVAHVIAEPLALQNYLPAICEISPATLPCTLHVGYDSSPLHTIRWNSSSM